MANADTASTDEDLPVLVDVAANDADPDDNLDPSSVVVTAPPANGTTTNHGDGTITHTPTSASQARTASTSTEQRGPAGPTPRR